MNNDSVRAPSGQALVASDGAQEVSTLSGFDPSRGVPRKTLVSIGRHCIRDHAGADCNEEIVGMIREHANELTGGNCTFADSDLNILAHLAERAIDAGLTDQLHPRVQAKIIALRSRRAASAMSAGTAETEGLRAKPASAASAAGDAPTVEVRP